MADFGTIQFQEAEALRKRVAELEEALRPFAAAYREMQATGQSMGCRHCDVKYFERAAELMKDWERP